MLPQKVLGHQDKPFMRAFMHMPPLVQSKYYNDKQHVGSANSMCEVNHIHCNQQLLGAHSKQQVQSNQNYYNLPTARKTHGTHRKHKYKGIPRKQQGQV